MSDKGEFGTKNTGRVGIILLDGCEDVETFGALDVYKRCGFDTKMVSLEAQELPSSAVVTTKCGIKFEPDELYNLNFTLDDFDIVHIPGGAVLPSYLSKKNGRTVVNFMDALVEYVQARGILAANCITPAILAKTGVFKKLGVKKATSYADVVDFVGDAFEKLFGSSAVWAGEFEKSVDEPLVVVDKLSSGVVTTANGPGATLEHAFLTASLVCDEVVVSAQIRNMAAHIRVEALVEALKEVLR
ncbi:MAG: DJ-1/PfpI family protein [Candidatus Ancillula trichonymphae]|nr:DJ-1/PfpI family protein [Candidatus Ancillula trichonymphae]